jgi:hypothetical protein
MNLKLKLEFTLLSLITDTCIAKNAKSWPTKNKTKNETKRNILCCKFFRRPIAKESKIKIEKSYFNNQITKMFVF